MFYYLVAPNRITRQNQTTFTYSSSVELTSGQIVKIPLGKQIAIGLVIKSTSKPEFATREILEIIEETPLPQPLVKSLLWLAQYYSSDLASVIQTALPTGITKKRRAKLEITKNHSAPTEVIPTEEQQNAISQIAEAQAQPFLLHGVTGSGKTTVYLELAKKELDKNNSVIFVVPEIALTAQLTRQVLEQFNQAIVYHSRLTEAERHLIWQKCLNSDQPQIIVGTRSALFLPLSKVGLIVIDEFHESSLKQDRNSKYSSTLLARQLSQHHAGKLILGSATPNAADYWLFEQKNYSIVEMRSPAQQATPAKISLIDLREKKFFRQHRFLSDQLLKSIRSSLSQQEQSLIFHNRRGSANITLCQNCGWMAECPTCQTPMTLHQDHFKLICHSCNLRQDVPLTCPECGSADITHKGIGTKLVTQELIKKFPDAKIKRFDTDTATQESLDQIYDQVASGEVGILVGTQTIAKGLNLEKLSTVGVIQADTGLALPDYTAEERTFQLLTQVIGRAGRTAKASRVIVQTYQPDHPVITSGITQDYATFYKYCLERRRKLNHPPFSYLLKIKVSFKTEATTLKHIRQIAQIIQQKYPQVKIEGPAPCFFEKARGKINWQILIKSPRRTALQQILSDLPTNSNYQFDLDPISLL